MQFEAFCSADTHNGKLSDEENKHQDVQRQEPGWLRDAMWGAYASSMGKHETYSPLSFLQVVSHCYNVSFSVVHVANVWDRTKKLWEEVTYHDALQQANYLLGSRHISPAVLKKRTYHHLTLVLSLCKKTCAPDHAAVLCPNHFLWCTPTQGD